MRFGFGLVCGLMCAITLNAASSHAQNMQHQVAGVGTLRFSTPTIENAPGYSYKTTPGFSVGALYILKFTENIAARAGVLYTTRTADLTYTGFLGAPSIYNTYNFTVEASYADFPVGIQYQPFSFPLYAILSGVFAMNIANSTEENQDYYNIHNFQIERSSYDMLVQVGLGYDIVKVSNLEVGVEFHYEHGLMDVEDTAAGFVSTYNRGFVVNALAKFNL